MIMHFGKSSFALALAILVTAAHAGADTSLSRNYRLDLSKPSYDCIAGSREFNGKKLKGSYDASVHFELLKDLPETLKAQAKVWITQGFDGDPSGCNTTVTFENVWSSQVSFTNAPKFNGKAQGPFQKTSQSVSFDQYYNLPRFYDTSDCKIVPITNEPFKTTLGIYGNDANIRLSSKGKRFQDLTLYGAVSLSGLLSIDANGAATLTQMQLEASPDFKFSWQSRIVELDSRDSTENELLSCGGSAAAF